MGKSGGGDAHRFSGALLSTIGSLLSKLGATLLILSKQS
jgi:hypothetical protein